MAARSTATSLTVPPAGEVVFSAAWLTPDCCELFSPGCVHVRDGRIVRVWEGVDADAIPLGDVVLLPGLVNTHTHLEFSDLAEPVASGAAFPDWIRAVMRSRRERPGEARTAIRRGWEECRASGAVAVGEIATEDAALDELVTLGASGVVYWEVLGLREERVDDFLAMARRFVDAGSTGSAAREGVGERNQGVDTPRSGVRRGLSPHAPYSIHPRLFRGLVDLAVETVAPVAMHLAETREELELLAHCRGGLVELLHSLGLWRTGLFTDFRRPLDYLRDLSRCHSALVVHGNYLDAEELDFLATQPQMSVVYCPRTHAAFGHAPHPWRAMLDRGIRVAFGTDSRASNPDLSLWNELRWLHECHPEFPVPSLLRMATHDAAEALGLSAEFGTLEPGKLAEMTLVRPSAPISVKDWSAIL